MMLLKSTADQWRVKNDTEIPIAHKHRIMGRNFTIQDILNSKVGHLNAHLRENATQKARNGRKSKFGNEKVEMDGERFDSRKEAKRWQELKLLLKAGHIGQLERQKPYELNPGGTHSLKYIADFVYIDATTGQTVTEDTKGFKTREYKKKKRLMLKVHGIAIKET